MKKESKKSLENYRAVFFLSGLVLALIAVLTTFSIEFVSFKPATLEVVAVEESKTTVIPITHPPQYDIPKEKVSPTDIDPSILPNPVDPPIVIPTDPLMNETGIVDIIDVPSYDPEIPVSEIELDRLPIFQGCETLQGDDRKDCMQSSLQRVIANNLNLRREDFEMLAGSRIFVRFIVGSDGYIKDVEVLRSPSANVEDQLKRIVNGLPRFVPGRLNGRDQAVQLYVPIRIKAN